MRIILKSTLVSEPKIISKSSFVGLASDKFDFKKIEEFKMLNLENVILYFKDNNNLIKKHFIISLFLYKNLDGDWVIYSDGQMIELKDFENKIINFKKNSFLSKSDYLISNYKSEYFNISKYIDANLIKGYNKNKKRIEKWSK